MVLGTSREMVELNDVRDSYNVVWTTFMLMGCTSFMLWK